METNKIIINEKKIYLIFLVLLFLIVGIILGIFYQNKKDIFKIEKTEAILKILNSEVVPSIVSYGIITEIKDREITMIFNEDPITIKIKDDASIHSVGKSAGESLSQLDFSQIKIGDVLNAEIKVNSAGTFESNSVIVFSK
jgi:hypothetical protein